MRFDLRAVVHFDVGSTDNVLNFVGSRANIRDTETALVYPSASMFLVVCAAGGCRCILSLGKPFSLRTEFKCVNSCLILLSSLIEYARLTNVLQTDDLTLK